MAESSHSAPGSPQPPRPTEPQENVVQRSVPITRFMFVLAIISSFLASFVLLVLGFIETIQVILGLLRFDGHHDMESVRLHFIEIIDIFLVATILYVIASGFFQLFGAPLREVPEWLRVESVDDLEHKLIGVLITVLGVLGLARVASWDGESNLLPFGITVSLLILSLGYFATRTGQHH